MFSDLRIGFVLNVQVDRFGTIRGEGRREEGEVTQGGSHGCGNRVQLLMDGDSIHYI